MATTDPCFIISQVLVRFKGMVLLNITGVVGNLFSDILIGAEVKGGFNIMWFVAGGNWPW